MGLLETFGIKGAGGGVDFTGVGTIIGIIILGFFVLVIAGGITFYIYYKKIKKTFFKNQIPIFLRVQGKYIRIGVDWAKEIFIPNTNISLFYLRDKKFYIARPTRAMGKDEYWYYISENGEWVNFDMTSIREEDTLAQANYDHRDTRYAFVNLQDILQKNYKDKSQKWWKDPTIMNIISFVIMSLIFVGAVVLILARVGALIEELGPIADKWTSISEAMARGLQTAQNINSGVAPATG